MSISVLILTLNEEANLPACLASVAWSDDVVVLDSYSADSTVDIASAAGARVYQRQFDNENNHRTYSLRAIPFKYSWVYNPDADEITSSELRDEMLAILANRERSECAFRVRRKDMLMGRWLRYSSLYPTWHIRLVRPEKVRFEREINLHCVVDGPEGRLKNHIFHYSFNNGLNAWYDKHNRYSWVEAKETLNSLRSGQFDWRGLFTIYDGVRRRQALKEFSYRLPLRPSFRFLYMYILRRGFLDGMPGYMYCRLLAAYEYMIVVKMAEIQQRERGLPI